MLGVLRPSMSFAGAYGFAICSKPPKMRGRHPLPTMGHNAASHKGGLQQRNFATPKQRSQKPLLQPKKPEKQQRWSSKLDEEAYKLERDVAWAQYQRSSQHEQLDKSTRSRAEERLSADMIYLQLKYDFRRNLRGRRSSHIFQHIPQLALTPHGRIQVEDLFGSIQTDAPGLIEAKRKSFLLTVFAPLGDVGIGWLLGRSITYLVTTIYLGVGRALCGHGVRLLHSMGKSDDEPPKP